MSASLVAQTIHSLSRVCTETSVNSPVRKLPLEKKVLISTRENLETKNYVVPVLSVLNLDSYRRLYLRGNADNDCPIIDHSM